MTLMAGDVRGFPFPSGEFRFVIHAAAETSEALTGSGFSAPLSSLTTIFGGTRQMLEFAAGAGTRRFLMVSSGAVYGPQPPAITHMPESFLGAPDHLLPGSAYGEGKRAAEALCAAYASETLVCAIARCFALVGPHLPLDGKYAIGNFISSAIQGQPIRIQGDGTPLRSYLYATDLMVWLWTLLFRGPSIVPINVGSAAALSIRELAETVRDVLRPGLPIEVLGEPKRGAAPPRYVPSVDRAREQMALVETVGLREAIERTAQWHGWRPGA